MSTRQKKEPMNTRAMISLAAAMFCALLPGVLQADQAETNKMNTIHDIAVTKIDGTVTNLTGYKGQVMLIVNVASRCGFTGQYAGLL
jgi:multisubunit Na+/H+ antiporter MnhE subunit